MPSSNNWQQQQQHALLCLLRCRLMGVATRCLILIIQPAITAGQAQFNNMHQKQLAVLAAG
jgi:hypothetical protein